MSAHPGRVTQSRSGKPKKTSTMRNFLLLLASAAVAQHLIISQDTVVPPGTVVTADSLTVASGVTYRPDNATLIVSGNVSILGNFAPCGGANVSIGGSVTAMSSNPNSGATITVRGDWTLPAGGYLHVGSAACLSVAGSLQTAGGSVVVLSELASLRIGARLYLTESRLELAGVNASVRAAGDVVTSTLLFTQPGGVLLVAGDLEIVGRIAGYESGRSVQPCDVRVEGTLRIHGASFSLDSIGTSFAVHNLEVSGQGFLGGSFMSRGSLSISGNVTVLSYGSVQLFFNGVSDGSALLPSIGGSITVCSCCRTAVLADGHVRPSRWAQCCR